MKRSIAALCLLIPACGGTVSVGPGSGNGGSSGAGGGEPQVHRSAPTSCPAPTNPAKPVPGPDPDPYRLCTSDAECIYGLNGRCEPQRGGMMCVYDQCYSDSECTGGAVCECRQGYMGNACLPSGCRVDTDCPGSWCSPTMGTCGAYSGTIGYQCHTPQDECTNDTDCTSPTMGPGYCMHEPTVGHWVCGYGQCVG